MSISQSQSQSYRERTQRACVKRSGPNGPVAVIFIACNEQTWARDRRDRGCSRASGADGRPGGGMSVHRFVAPSCSLRASLANTPECCVQSAQHGDEVDRSAEAARCRRSRGEGVTGALNLHRRARAWCVWPAGDPPLRHSDCEQGEGLGSVASTSDERTEGGGGSCVAQNTTAASTRRTLAQHRIWLSRTARVCMWAGACGLHVGCRALACAWTPAAQEEVVMIRGDQRGRSHV
eukprot:363970-Chlamydomonas_euryale.AAC.11